MKLSGGQSIRCDGTMNVWMIHRRAFPKRLESNRRVKIAMRKAKIGMAVSLIFLLSLSALAFSQTPAKSSAKPEGTLVIALEGLREESFLPDIGSPDQVNYWEVVYDYLFYTDMKTRDFIPGLALKFEYSKDYKNITVWLRKGVKWHENWGEVTAEDVKYTFERCMKKGSSNEAGADLRGSVNRIEVLDPYTLVFRLKEPDPVFWGMLTYGINPTTPIICKKYIETAGDDKAKRQPIGSGPYRLVEHNLGDHMKFEALSDHWRIVPEFKYLVLRAVVEESTRVAMLKTGAVDVTPISTNSMTDLQKSGIKTLVSSAGYIPYITFGGMLVPEDRRYVKGVHRTAPWADVKVREAMNIAIDRDTIAKSIYAGAAKPAVIAPTVPGWNEVQPYPYHPVKAKQLLADAGFPNGFAFKLYTSPQSPGQEIPKLAEIVANYWEKIGLKPSIVLGRYEDYRKMAEAGKDAQILWTGRQSYRDEWSSKWGQDYTPNGGLPKFQSPEAIAFMKRIDGEMNFAKRKTIWKEVARYHRDAHTQIPLVIALSVWGVSKKVGEWPQNLDLRPKNFVYIRQANPLNTWRLFNL